MIKHFFIRLQRPKLAAVLVLMLLASVLPPTLSARDFEYTYEGKTLTYTVIDEDAKTVKTKEGPHTDGLPGNEVAGVLVIPATVNDGENDYTVVELGVESFYGCSSLESVELPNTLIAIGDFAFCKCSALMEIDIPNSVTTVGEGAFMYCSGLKNVTIGESVSVIGDSAFYDCNSLGTVVLPESITEMGSRVFGSCDYLSSINIPMSFTTVPHMFVAGCGNLRSIVIPDSVTEIENSAFEGCSRLSNVKFGQSVAHVGYASFSRCTGLNYITIPASLTNIDIYAFSGCDYLKEIVLESSTPPTIAESSFMGHSQSIYTRAAVIVPENALPNYVTDVNWSKFTTIKDNNVTSAKFTTGGFKYAIVGKNALMLLPYNSKYSELTTVDLSKAVTYNNDTYYVTIIGENAFYKCTKLTSVTFSDKLTEIREEAFGLCEGLKNFSLPPSLRTIGKGAFRGCAG